MRAVRAGRFFDGEQFRRSGATVLVAGGKVVGVEPFGFDPPPGCPVLSYAGTLLPGLIDAHTPWSLTAGRWRSIALRATAPRRLRR
jgi:imidazolonepropionase-like amidohydrolase